MNAPEPQKMHYLKPSIEKVDAASNSMFSASAALNDFNIRLTSLRNSKPEWNDPKNQHRPFKYSFVNFIKDLIPRLPVTPDITPTVDGNVLLRFRKRAPTDKWQNMEITIYPQRHFSMIVRSRIANEPPFTKNNIARPDILSDAIRLFYEYDAVSGKDHPIRYRRVTSIDYPAISGMAIMTMGLFDKYSTKNIPKLLEYAVVADDPVYGIVSVAGIGKGPKCGEFINPEYEVALCMTVEPLRGLGIGGKCLRKALTNLLVDHPDANVTAAVQMEDDTVRDNCRGILTRSGFNRVKIINGEKKYRNFECDRCNLCRYLCDYGVQSSNCSTVYYQLGNRGGKQGYGGKKTTE